MKNRTLTTYRRWRVGDSVDSQCWSTNQRHARKVCKTYEWTREPFLPRINFLKQLLDQTIPYLVYPLPKITRSRSSLHFKWSARTGRHNPYIIKQLARLPGPKEPCITLDIIDRLYLFNGKILLGEIEDRLIIMTYWRAINLMASLPSHCC